MNSIVGACLVIKISVGNATLIALEGDNRPQVGLVLLDNLKYALPFSSEKLTLLQFLLLL